MPTRTGVKTDFVDRSSTRWTLLANGDDGSPSSFLGSGERVIQFTGTFGTGGTVIVEGSIDGTNWFQLRDPSSTLISLTAPGLRSVLETVPFVRPRVTAGDGTTSITAILDTRRSTNT